MRVAFVAYHTSPLASPGTGDAGGMNVYVRELASGLGRLGIGVDIFTRSSACSERVSELARGVRVVPVVAGPRTGLGKGELTDFLPAFAEGIESFRLREGGAYDVVHSHYWQSGLVAGRLAREWDVPLVHTYHTLARTKNRLLASGDEPEPLERVAAEEVVFDAADLLTASSKEELAELGKHAASILRPGVDHRLFSPGDRALARRHLGLDGEQVLLCVGRIQRLKGLELALRSLALLIPTPLLLVAGGPSGADGEREVDRLLRLARSLHVEHRVRFLGPKPRRELPVLYRTADVALVCSHSESFGFAALEAHACGTPVVGTAVGAIPEIVLDGESGFVVEARDPGVFAARIHALLGDPNRRERFSDAAVRSATRFHWDRTARQLLESYEQLAGDRVTAEV